MNEGEPAVAAPTTIFCRPFEAIAMKPRHHLYLDDELTDRLDALAAKPGSSKSAIVADALRAYLAAARRTRYRRSSEGPARPVQSRSWAASSATNRS